MRKRRSITTAICALGLGISVTACGVLGGASDKKDAGADTSAAAGVGTALNKKIATVRTEAGKQQTYKSKTVVEYDGELASTVEAQVRLSDLSQRTRTTTYPAAYAAMGLTPNPGRQTSELLLLPDVSYSKFDPSSKLYNEEKPWSKMTRTDSARPTGPTKAVEEGEGPMAGLDRLVASGEIRVVGEEAVDGVRTTHYAGTVSVMRLLEDSKLSAEDRESTRKLYEALGMDRMNLDLWVGPDDLPVKQVSVMPVKFSKPIAQKVTITFTDWGKPVDLTPPPADQVEDLDNLPPLPSLFPTASPTASAKTPPSPTTFPTALPSRFPTSSAPKASTLPVEP